MDERFHDILKKKIHILVSLGYDYSDKFPKDERFGLISQLRRAIMSVMLNYVEGYARKREKVKLNFYEMSYGSLQESKYILFFAFDRGWVEKVEYDKILEMADEVGKMLWSTISLIEKKVNK